MLQVNDYGPYLQTFLHHLRKINMEKLKIIPYEQQYHQEYKMLSLEWLEKLDLYEDADKLQTVV